MLKQNFSRRKFIKGIASGTVGTIFLSSLPTKMFGEDAIKDGLPKNENYVGQKLGVRLNCARLPIIYKADMVIIGGSLAGVTAALEFARAGVKVVLIEHRNYLGREIASTLKPWVDLGKLALQPPEPFASCFKKMQAEGMLKGELKTSEIPLWIDAFKISTEDVLLEAGVELIYSSQPIGTIMNNGVLNGVVIGNKSGRQAVLGRFVIDTSSTAVVARIAGGTFEPETDKDFQFVRTVEMEGVLPLKDTVLKVPENLGIVSNKLIVHHGYRDNGHVLIECPMELKLGKMDMKGMMMREIEARHRTLRVASYLIKNVPAFKTAKLGFCSYELEGAQTTRLEGSAPKWADDLNAFSLNFKDKKQKQVHLPLTNFAGPINGLWCLNEAARLEVVNRDLIHDPVNLALIGASFAKTLLQTTGSNKTANGILTDYKVPYHLDHNFDVKLQDSPQRGRNYERLIVPAEEVPVHHDVDFVVVGGGTSGATCANSAGREGLKTVVLELAPGLGGTGTVGGVTAYWYGRYWAGFCIRNAKLVDEIHETVNWPLHANKLNGRWNKECKMYALLKDSLNSGVEVIFNTITFAAVLQDNKVCGVITATPYGPMSVLGKIIADTTGDGDVAAFAGAKYTFGAARDHYPMLFNLAIYTSPTASTWHFMHTVDVTNVEDYTRGVLLGRRRGPVAHDHGIYIATRESRHIIGDTVVSLTDMLQHRPFPDVINIGAGQMDCHRRIASDWIRMGLLMPILPTEMPLRAITPQGLENILVGGKAFSGKHDALYNMRNMPDLENLGGAMGVIAAHAIKEGVSPRMVDLPKVQKRLVEVGTLLPEMLTREINDVPLNETAIRGFVKELDGRPLTDWYDVQMAKENEPNFRQKIPIVEICTADPYLTVPILEEELVTATGNRQIQLAQALSMFGSKTGVPVLIAAIEQQIADKKVPPNLNSLPRLRAGDGNRRIPPADLLYSLAMSRDKRSLAIWDKMSDLIKPEPKAFDSESQVGEQQNPWVYEYVDSICYGAELLGDIAAISSLKKIHGLPLLNDLSVKKGIQIDYAFERRSLIELTLGRGLAHLGDSEGYEVLISYLNDNRANLAEFAHMTLEQLTGLDLNKNSRLWEQFLTGAKGSLKPIPLIERSDG